MEATTIPTSRGLKLAIMQPYFLPYIGYFQLLSSVDVFVIYDNIKYTKKGWINRNRFLLNGNSMDFSIPLKKDSDFLDVSDRQVSDGFLSGNLLNRFREAYRGAPYAKEVLPIIEEILCLPERNLFEFIRHSVERISCILGIQTRIIVSSQLEVNHDLKSQEKVLAICQHLGADTYINTIGGRELYSRETFLSHGIDLWFIQTRSIEYPQFGQPFVPWLSILDVMMFNSVKEIRDMLGRYELIK